MPVQRLQRHGSCRATQPPLLPSLQVAVAIIQDGISHCDSTVLAASTVQVRAVACLAPSERAGMGVP